MTAAAIWHSTLIGVWKQHCLWYSKHNTKKYLLLSFNLLVRVLTNTCLIVRRQAQIWVWTFACIAMLSVDTLVTATSICHCTLIGIWNQHLLRYPRHSTIGSTQRFLAIVVCECIAKYIPTHVLLSVWVWTLTSVACCSVVTTASIWNSTLVNIEGRLAVTNSLGVKNVGRFVLFICEYLIIANTCVTRILDNIHSVICL